MNIKVIMIRGLILRLFFLTLVLFLGELNIVDPFFITDDISYELLAKAYIMYANNVVDVNAFSSIGAAGYLTTFWPWVMCISSYLFETVVASRFINIIISSLCIGLIYRITYEISNNLKTSFSAAKLYAYMPLPVMVSCFPIKDIYLTFAVLYVFWILIKFQYSRNIKIGELVFFALLILGSYYTRGAVVELIFLFALAFIVEHYYRRKQYIRITLFILIAISSLFYIGNELFLSFDNKINDYFNVDRENTAISILRIDSIYQIYKLPFTYFIAMLQPAKFSLFTTDSSSFWLSVISYFNLSLYPIAIGNLIYVIVKKQNWLFWITSLIMYCSIIILSLGVFRHYLFLLPISFINYALFCETTKGKYKQCVILSTIFLMFIVLIYSLWIY